MKPSPEKAAVYYMVSLVVIVAVGVCLGAASSLLLKGFLAFILLGVLVFYGTMVAMFADQDGGRLAKVAAFITAAMFVAGSIIIGRAF